MKRKGFIIFCLLSLTSISVSVSAAPAKVLETITFTIQSTPVSDFQSELTIYPASREKILAGSVVKSADAMPVSDTYATLKQAGSADNGTTYIVDKDYNLYDPAGQKILTLTEKKKEKLRRHIEALRSRHYGELLPWKVARQVIPRKDKVEVIDLETGLRFHVQRRAGQDHADVQPLTKEDTRIMKEIYKGSWSWKRRAILVRAGNRYYAASMNGMPHGGDGIPGNEFDGHSCIHFAGSTTHGSHSEDTGHQLMTYRAAGLLRDYINQASPAQLVDAFVLAMNQNDPQVLDLITYPHNAHFVQDLHTQMQDIDAVTKVTKTKNRQEMPAPDPGLLMVQIKEELAVTREGSSRARKGMFSFTISRDKSDMPWRITEISTGDHQKEQKP
ncbi:hypothetical protein [Paenibacillus lutrae]|uniref:Uncharacterized protein n=1 Tax=Paenibacillus lutrae TaxID=2078573 RepID=A0A7X3K1S5_9BACL|nr:hypothetical protein [Paenibacillus lutrae]MVP02301.1 hypothetical protein [Paenibacillus lutrae]